MNKRAAMLKYWRFIQAVQKHEGVTQEVARKYFKPLSHAVYKCSHARDDEEFMRAEQECDDIIAMMLRYDKFFRSLK